MPDAIRDALLAALLDCVTALDLSDDELVDPGFASDVLGDVTGHLDALGAEDRALLVTLIEQRAASETSPERREYLAEAAEHFGLRD